MSEVDNSGLSRRELMKKTGQVAAASAWPASPCRRSMPARTTPSRSPSSAAAAAAPARRPTPSPATNGPTRARRHGRRLPGSAQQQPRQPQARATPRQVDVPESRRFIGFDGYRRAMDALRPGDVVILTTPPAFRWVAVHLRHREAASTSSWRSRSPSTARARGACSRSASEPSGTNLKVGVGLMCRHCDARKELFDRIQDGADRRHHPAPRLPHARPDRDRPSPRRKPDEHQRADVPDPALPLVPLGLAAAASATSTSTTSTNAAG